MSYKVEIQEASKAFTKRETIKIKDVSNAVKFDEIAECSPVVITPAAYAVLLVHNDKSENKDYPLYIILDKDDNKYMTGSDSFWNSFIDIWVEMTEGVDEPEEFEIEVYKKDSKNYKGKKFLTCSIV